MDELTPAEKAVRDLRDAIAGRVGRGEKVEAVRQDLFAQGVRPDIVEALLAPYASGRWQQGVRGLVLRSLGVLVVAGGVALYFGNTIGFLPTVPFAGTVAIFAGCGLYVAGKAL